METKNFSGLVVSNEPQANESFSVQQFFKNAAEVWASSPHLRSKSNCTMKLQQKSKRKSQRIAIAFQIMSRRQLKSFLLQQFFKNAGEVQGE